MRIEPPSRNPFKSILARTVEIVYAPSTRRCASIGRYEPPAEPAVAVTPRAGVGHGCTEAPRGMLYHRYRIGEGGSPGGAHRPADGAEQKIIESDLRR